MRPLASGVLRNELDRRTSVAEQTPEASSPSIAFYSEYAVSPCGIPGLLEVTVYGPNVLCLAFRTVWVNS